MVRLKEIKEKQLKSLRVRCLPLAAAVIPAAGSHDDQSSLLGRKIQVQQLVTQHMNLMHEVYTTLLQFDL